MPFYARKPRTYKKAKRTFRRKRKYNLNKTVARIVKKNAEWKINEVNYSGQAMTTTVTTHLLNGLNQNPSSETRIGNVVNWESIQINGFIANADTVTHRVRLSLVWDRQSNGVSPTDTQVYDTSLLSYVNGAPRLLANRSRFIILRDMIFTISPASIDSADNRIIKYFRKVNKKTTYSGTGATAASINTGSLHLFYASTDTGSDVTITYASRLRFTDM